MSQKMYNMKALIFVYSEEMGVNGYDENNRASIDIITMVLWDEFKIKKTFLKKKKDVI